MSDQERPCGCLFKGYEVVSQCIYHTGRQHLIDSLQRENAALRDVLDRRGNLSKYVDSGNLLAKQKSAAITPEMREILKRAFALAREIEDRELAEDLCGLLIRTDHRRGVPSTPVRIHT